MASAPIDFEYCSRGGILMDGTGDIADTRGTMDSTLDMIRTRVTAAINGWKLYAIGAGLQQAVGRANTNELSLVINRRVTAALTNNFLTSGSFTVQSLILGETITVYIYAQNLLITTVTVPSTVDSFS